MSSENKYKYIGMTIYTNESKKKVEFNDFSFINKEVGGHFECITIPDMTIWINEEGKIIGFPINKIASKLSNIKSIKNNTLSIIDLFRTYIVGNAVFLGVANSNGEVESLTESQLYFLSNYS